MTTGWFRGEISSYLPQNGWVVVEVEESGERVSEHIVAPAYRLPALSIGKVVTTSELDGEEVVPVGARILFPSVYRDSLVADIFHHHLRGRYYTLRNDSILAIETEEGGFDGVDLWFYGR